MAAFILQEQAGSGPEEANKKLRKRSEQPKWLGFTPLQRLSPDRMELHSLWMLGAGLARGDLGDSSLSSAQKLHSPGVMCQMCGELLNQNSTSQIIF